MSQVHRRTALIEPEGDCLIVFCPELDIAIQGDYVEESRFNLQEALEVFFEAASPQEVRERL